MATAATKAASLTTLVIGRVEVAVGLFTTVAKPGKLETFATAGPNGGVLQARTIARATPVSEVDVPDAPVHSDPFADDPVRVAENDRQQVIAEAIDGHRALDDDAVLDAIDPVPGPEAMAAFKQETREYNDRAIAAADASLAASVPGEYGRELVEQGTGEIVLPQDVRRGVRLEDGSFIDCTEQLAAIDERTKLDRMEVVPHGFVDITRIPRARVAATYYLGAADEKAPRALRMMYEGLKRKRRGAVVKLTKRSRQSLGVIGWHGKCLVLYELSWSDDFRDPPARALAPQKAVVSDAEVDAFCELVDAWSGRVEVLDDLRDDAVALRRELMAKALAGEVAEVVASLPSVPEDDVMAQLEASLAAVS